MVVLCWFLMFYLLPKTGLRVPRTWVLVPKKSWILQKDDQVISSTILLSKTDKQNWTVLSDEQMSNGWPFSLLNDEQMSNKVGVEHQPEKQRSFDESLCCVPKTMFFFFKISKLTPWGSSLCAQHQKKSLPHSVDEPFAFGGIWKPLGATLTSRGRCWARDHG